MPTPTAHVRERLRARRGNQFYLDRSERTPSTLCGADITDRDVMKREARAAVRNGWPVCERCLELLEREGR